MARIAPNKQKWHILTIREDGKGGESVLVRGGKQAYLWVGADLGTNGSVFTFSGPQTLKKLARAILAEVK